MLNFHPARERAVNCSAEERALISWIVDTLFTEIRLEDKSSHLSRVLIKMGKTSSNLKLEIIFNLYVKLKFWLCLTFVVAQSAKLAHWEKFEELRPNSGNHWCPGSTQSDPSGLIDTQDLWAQWRGRETHCCDYHPPDIRVLLNRSDRWLWEPWCRGNAIRLSRKNCSIDCHRKWTRNLWMFCGWARDHQTPTLCPPHRKFGVRWNWFRLVVGPTRWNRSRTFPNLEVNLLPLNYSFLEGALWSNSAKLFPKTTKH